MKRQQARVPVMLSVVLLLSACNGSGQGSDAPAVTARPDSAPVAAPAVIKPEAVVVNGPNSLQVAPGHVFACDGRDRTVSTITWSSTDPAVQGVTIKVQSQDDAEAKVFTQGGAKGSAETGDWVVAGVRIFMIDSDSGAELASTEISALPCK